ncbi:MAG: carbamoyl phosphate synthase small subunit [Ruminococcaceae bacterium]|nr:carbamoyl phosphate synthase small subunit [Oscillospiraceae bacterium]
MKKAYLALADGTVFEGKSLGAQGTVFGEIVFTTGMTGYTEVLTDPAFSGQLVTMTYPLIGNSGVNHEDYQSEHATVSGVIMKECAKHPNNFRMEESLESFLEREHVVAITGIDTRALTKIIRTSGSMNAVLTTEEPFSFEAYSAKLASYVAPPQLEAVSCKEAYTVGEGEKHVAVLDFGLRRDILASLLAKGVRATVYPAATKAEAILADKPDGIMLVGGPGNPADYASYLPEIKALMESEKPFFAIDLGHQLAALAMGGKTEKLKFGHRGANQPVKDLAADRTFVTCQNHGYAVIGDSLDPAVATVTHINLNDQTVEGIRYVKLPAVSIQFHPDSKPGSKTDAYVFDEFINMMGGKDNA